METIVKEKLKYYDLSYPQKRILRIENLYSGTPVCNIGGVTRITGTLNLDIFNDAVNIFIEKNENLRLRMNMCDGEVRQYIHNYERENIEFKDFSSEINPMEAADKWSKEYFNIPFNLFDSNLYRFAIYKVDDNNYGIILCIHHIISDGWSTCIVQKRTLEIYFELLVDRNYEPSVEPSYTSFLDRELKYIDSPRFFKDRDYLKDLFGDVDEEFLYNSEDTGVGIRKDFNLTEEFSENINSFLSENNISRNTFFTFIVGLYLYRKTNKKDTIVGNLSFNRMTRKERATLGMCANILPVKITINEDKNVLELIDDISIQLKKGFYHQQYPYNKLIDDLKLKEKGYDSLFRFRVNSYKTDYFIDRDNFKFEIEEYYNGYQNYSLQIITKEIMKNNIILCIDYKPSEYKEQDIIEMYDYMMCVISKILKNPHKAIGNIIK